MKKKNKTESVTSGDKSVVANGMTQAALDENKAKLEQKHIADLAVAEHSAALTRMGKEIIDKVLDIGNKYMELCKYIRKNALAPKLVSYQLGELGFHRNVVYKINYVSNVEDKLWKEYEAGNIAFNKVLDLDKGSVIEMIADSTGTDSTALKAEIADAAAESMEGTSEGQNADAVKAIKEEKDKLAFTAAALRVLSYAEKHNIKSKSWTKGRGWVVTVTREKDYKVKQAAANLAAEKTKAATESTKASAPAEEASTAAEPHGETQQEQ